MIERIKTPIELGLLFLGKRQHFSFATQAIPKLLNSSRSSRLIESMFAAGFAMAMSVS